MRRTHIHEHIALTTFLILLVAEIAAVCYATLYVYTNATKWLLSIAGALSTVNVTRFVNVPAGTQYFVEYPHDYHFVVDQPGKCEQQKPFLVLIVPVSPRNRADRDVIRRTWGSEIRRPVSGKTVSLFFLLGLPAGEGAEQVQRRVLEESAEHGDLLQADFLDSYNNLTIKTMLMLEWLDFRCPGVAYAMKVDTDVFLNVPNLVDMLSETPKDNYLTGLIAFGARAVRDADSKWHLPLDVYPGSHYPPYAQGGAYVLSLDLPRKLVEASRRVKAVYLEDVYLGLCMEYLRVPLTKPPNLSLFPSSVPYSRCAYSKVIRATIPPAHLNTTVRMDFWEDFKRPDPYCYIHNGSVSHELRPEFD